jgi:hypothetical protein
MSEPKNFLARWSRRKREAAAEGEDARKTPAPSEPTLPLVPAQAGTQSPSSEGQSQSAESEQAGLDSRLRGNERESVSAATGLKHSGLAEPVVDLSKLPPIESITAETDIRAFLASGVPPELTRAALRRAWSADTAIRDFVGLSENSWDFNAPDSMPGFGPLQMTDELRRQIARMVGAASADEADGLGAAQRQASEPPTSIGTSVGSAATKSEPAAPAVQHEHDMQSDVAAGELCDRDPPLQRKDDTALQHGEKSEPPQPLGRRGHGGALPE